jgi:hypothetical protein
VVVHDGVEWLCYDPAGRLDIIQVLAECEAMKKQKAKPTSAPKTNWKTIALAFGLGLVAGAVGATVALK